MKYNPAIHKRKSKRLQGYDYSQTGLYFITICVQNRELLFGEIENDEMILNDAGKMIQNEWGKLPQRFSNIELHEFVVMPNHFHGILEIVRATTRVAPTDGTQDDAGLKNDAGISSVGATLVVAPNNDTPNTDNRHEDAPNNIGNKNEYNVPTSPPTDKTVGDMIAAFKSITTVEYIQGVKNSDWQPFNGKLWQRNYYEQIIRNKEAHENISDYINNNPARWEADKFYRI